MCKFTFSFWFCKTLTFSESTCFRQKAANAYLSSNVVFGLAEAFTSNLTCFKENLNHHSTVSWEGITISESSFVFKIARERSLVLIVVHGFSQTSSDVNWKSELKQPRSMPIKNNLRKINWFQLVATNACLFLNAVLGSPRFVPRLLSAQSRWEVIKYIFHFWREFAEKRNFQKVLWFWETCLIVFKYGFWARLHVNLIY